MEGLKFVALIIGHSPNWTQSWRSTWCFKIFQL